VEARKVLEVEADLLNSRQEMANAMTQYRRALMQVDLTEGALLERHNVEITHEAFQEQTRQWLANPRRPFAQPAASPPVSN